MEVDSKSMKNIEILQMTGEVTLRNLIDEFNILWATND